VVKSAEVAVIPVMDSRSVEPCESVAVKADCVAPIDPAKDHEVEVVDVITYCPAGGEVIVTDGRLAAVNRAVADHGDQAGSVAYAPLVRTWNSIRPAGQKFAAMAAVDAELATTPIDIKVDQDAPPSVEDRHWISYAV